MVTRSVLHVGPGGPGVPPHTHDGSEIEGVADLIHLRVDQLLAGTITGKEITVAGGAAGVIRSDNFASGVDGWAIFGDGSAELNAVVVRGTIVAGTGSEVDWSYIKNVSIENADIVSLSFDKITAATNTASLVVGSAGSISSANYSAGSAGFIVKGDGSAEFNDVTVRGDIVSGNWDGADPVDLSSVTGSDANATLGFAFDSSKGAAHFAGPAFFGKKEANGLNGLNTGVGSTSSSIRWLRGGDVIGDMYATGNNQNDDPRLIIRGPDDASSIITLQKTGGGILANVSIGFHVEIGGRLFLVQKGSAASPALTFSSDPNTGLYLRSATQLGLAAGGVAVMVLDDANGPHITTHTTTASAANTVINTSSSPANRLQRSTSALKYKRRVTTNVDYLADLELVPTKHWRVDDKAWKYGLIADWLVDQDPLLGEYGPDGEVENYDLRAVITVLAAKVNRLEADVAALKGAA